MKKKKGLKSLAILLASMFCTGMAMAQTSLNASGGDATGSGGSVTYSVGQVFYTTNTSSAGAVAQGVQHPYEIYTLGVQKNTGINISLNVYPNPTSNMLNLQIKNYKKEKLSFRLYGLQGKLIKIGQINSNQPKIDMSSLAKSTYFIQILDNKNQKVKSFKIIKD